MNITLIHYASPPVVGGVETVLARQAELFARAGHHVQDPYRPRGSLGCAHPRLRSARN